MSPQNQESDVINYGNEAVQRPVDAALENRSTRHGVLVAQAPQKKAKRKTTTKLKKARTLLVVDSDDENLKKTAPIYARQILKLKGNKVSQNVKYVNSFEELAKLLQEYESIDKLVLFFHGIPGGLIIDGDVKSLDKVDDIFKGHRPKIESIDIESCNVGEGAGELVPFAKLFKSSKITAWNQSWLTLPIEVEVPQNVDVKALDEQLAPFKGYFLKGTPIASELAKKPGKHRLIVDWFRLDLDETPLPPAPPPGELDTRRSFKARSTAKTRRIKSDKADKFQEEYKNKPIRPLEHIIIEISD